MFLLQMEGEKDFFKIKLNTRALANININSVKYSCKWDFILSVYFRLQTENGIIQAQIHALCQQ